MKTEKRPLYIPEFCQQVNPGGFVWMYRTVYAGRVVKFFYGSISDVIIVTGTDSQDVARFRFKRTVRTA